MGHECCEKMGDGFYDVVMVKMKSNWKYNLTVSFMETKPLTKEARKAADNLSCLHSDCFIINIEKLQVNESVLVVKLRKKKNI